MNYKIRVENEAESKEAQELLFELGGKPYEKTTDRFGLVVFANGVVYVDRIHFENYYTDLFSHFYGLFYFIFVELFISKNILFKNIFFLSYNLNVIKFAGCNYNSFINLNY